MNVFDKIYEAYGCGVDLPPDESCNEDGLVQIITHKRRRPHFVMLGKNEYYQLMNDDNFHNNCRTYPDRKMEVFGIEIIRVLKDSHYSVGWNDIG